jgi:AcrR family transcriptional regulator
MSRVEAAPPSQRPMRADARRNWDLLLAAANTAFATHGVNASLEDIARHAGVGIGTLYRHFPTRLALAEAVYQNQIETLCAGAERLLDAPSPTEALAEWLRALVVFGATKRGVAEFLKTAMQTEGSNLAWCKEALRAAGGALLARAQQSGEVRTDIQISDLLGLAHAISWAAEQTPDDADRSERMLALLMDALRCRKPGAE